MSEASITGAIVPYRAQLPAVRDTSAGATPAPPQQAETVVHAGTPEPPPVNGRDVRQAAFSGADHHGETQVGHNSRPQNLAEVVGRTRQGVEDARATEIARRQAGGSAIPGLGSELRTAKNLLRGIFGGNPEPAPASTHAEEWRMGGANGPTLTEAASRGMETARTGLADAANRFSRWVGTAGQQPSHAAPPQQTSQGGPVPEEWSFTTGPIPGAQEPAPAAKRYC